MRSFVSAAGFLSICFASVVAVLNQNTAPDSYELDYSEHDNTSYEAPAYSSSSGSRISVTNSSQPGPGVGMAESRAVCMVCACLCGFVGIGVILGVVFLVIQLATGQNIL